MVEENTFLNADYIYEDVEGEAGKTLTLEEDQERNLIGIIKDRYSLAEMARETRINKNTLHKAITNVKNYLINEKD